MSQRGGPVGDGYHHRSAFKKGNKPFKGVSKGKLERQNHGKVIRNNKDGTGETTDPQQHRINIKQQQAFSIIDPDNKESRANRRKQIQQQKRAELIKEKRIGTSQGPPILVAFIPLNHHINIHNIIQRISTIEGVIVENHHNPLLHSFSWCIGAGQRSKRFTVYETPRDQHAILDIAKVADEVCFILSPIATTESASSISSISSSLSADSDDCIDVDDFGRHAVTILKAQGMLSVIGIVTDYSALSTKKAATFKRTAQRYFHTAFGEEVKIVDDAENSTNSTTMLLRWITEIKLKTIQWRDSRSYLLAENIQYDAEKQHLSVTGYLRGNRHLAANRLLHITGQGDYQIHRIEERVRQRDTRNKQKKSNHEDIEMSTEDINQQSGEIRVLAASTQESRESLISVNPIDPLAHEQSIITEEELAAAEAGDVDEDEMNDGEITADERIPANKSFRGKQLAPGETDHQQSWNDVLQLDDDDEGDSYDDTADDVHLVDDDEKMAISSIVSKQKLERDEIDFPDEVEYPLDTICRQRFARYRGLKSFRESPWDIKENLPLEYSQIFQFADYKHSRAKALQPEKIQTLEGEVEAGVASQRSTPITIYLLDVSPQVASSLLSSHSPIVLFSLFAHEHKVSVLHFLVHRQTEYNEPIKGKQLIEFHCGFRRFVSSPIYSHHANNQESQKANRNRALVERFFHHGRFTIASVYQRIIFPPAPVLMFIPSTSASTNSFSSLSVINPIVASGSLLSVDPDRLLVKRIILTGSCISAHRRSAVVRHMFFNAADVSWFAPVELWTKMGCVGHIKESRGTKGHMKCLFNSHIKQNDTVCMSLYKRQFPKFTMKQFTLH